MNLLGGIFGIPAISKGKIYFTHGAKFSKNRSPECAKFTPLFLVSMASKTMAHITTQTTYIEKPSQSHVGKVARHIFNDKRATSSFRIELLDWDRGREAAFDKLKISNRAVFGDLSFIEPDSSGYMTMRFGVRIGSQTADT